MLVFISDLHLSDLTANPTISPDAFTKFADVVKGLAANAEAKDIEIVYLGDIFEMMSTQMWLDYEKLRPWSAKDSKEKKKTLESLVRDILIKVCEQNKSAMDNMSTLAKEMDKLGAPVSFRYMPGNHDWIVNEFPRCRKEAAEFLLLDHDKNERFEADHFWPDYRVFARHGDIYDRLNFSGRRENASVGDAVMIELVARLMREVSKEKALKHLVPQLLQIANVRPSVDIPTWLDGFCRRTEDAALREKLENIATKLFKEFVQTPVFLTMVGRSGNPKWLLNAIDFLGLGDNVARWVMENNPLRHPALESKFKDIDYGEKAYNELALKRNDAQYVVYGHTHEHRVEGLDIIPYPHRKHAEDLFQLGNLAIDADEDEIRSRETRILYVACNDLHRLLQRRRTFKPPLRSVARCTGSCSRVFSLNG